MPSSSVARRASRGPRAFVALALAALLAIGVATAALAASPKKGVKFTGTVNATPIAGFKPRVSFRVSKDGKSVTGFSFGSNGCQGSGGSPPGHYPFATFKFSKAIPIQNGQFGAVVNGPLGKEAYTGKVTGSFKSAKAAAGTVQVKQAMSGGCVGLDYKYSAKTK